MLTLRVRTFLWIYSQTSMSVDLLKSKYTFGFDTQKCSMYKEEEKKLKCLDYNEA